SCRRWREHNRDATSQHYTDVVVPFRTRRSTYQREWRIERSLREIRDEIEPGLRSVERSLARLLARGDRSARLQAGAARGPRPRAGGPFSAGMRIAAAIAHQMTELASLVRCIDALSRAWETRDTRRD